MTLNDGESDKEKTLDELTLNEERDYFRKPLSEAERAQIRFMVRYLITAVIFIIIAGLIVAVVINSMN